MSNGERSPGEGAWGCLLGARGDAAQALEELCSRAGLTLVCRVDTAASAMSAALAHRPDLCLLSTSLEADGLTATARLTGRLPSLPVILLDDAPNAHRLRHALRAGAAGYLPANLDDASLLRAVESVRRGQLAIPRDMVRQLVDDLLRPGRRTVTRMRSTGADALSAREREILGLLGRGLSSERIAAELYLAPATVRSHVHRISKKLGLRGREALVAFAKDDRARP